LIPQVPVEDAPGWVRKAANAINGLIRGTVQKDGNALYPGATAGASYDQAKMQAVMDAVHAISERLK